MSDYTALFITSVNNRNALEDGVADENELTQVLGLQTEEKGKLHSIIPKVHEGTTIGYMLIFEKDTNAK